MSYDLEFYPYLKCHRYKKFASALLLQILCDQLYLKFSKNYGQVTNQKLLILKVLVDLNYLMCLKPVNLCRSFEHFTVAEKLS